jgi:hypothetical protein
MLACSRRADASGGSSTLINWPVQQPWLLLLQHLLLSCNLIYLPSAADNIPNSFSQGIKETIWVACGASRRL